MWVYAACVHVYFYVRVREGFIEMTVDGVPSCLHLVFGPPSSNLTLKERESQLFLEDAESTFCFSSSSRHSRSVSRSCCCYLRSLYPSSSLSFLTRHRFAHDNALAASCLLRNSPTRSSAMVSKPPVVREAHASSPHSKVLVMRHSSTFIRPSLELSLTCPLSSRT